MCGRWKCGIVLPMCNKISFAPNCSLNSLHALPRIESATVKIADGEEEQNIVDEELDRMATRREVPMDERSMSCPHVSTAGSGSSASFGELGLFGFILYHEPFSDEFQSVSKGISAAMARR